ncbi:endonuclease domain-containing protein [Actinocatenispora sera]|uniref:endonuclease domain-containing protein n=1 Tax=Actinocatenispora sera TaxID=390989 RepID=UPI0014701A1B|nr:endonuclease domain-containing protein [Actinocatenispora sera]
MGFPVGPLLGQMPEHRRLSVVWQLILDHDADGIERAIRDQLGTSCLTDVAEPWEVVDFDLLAVEGDDGRYHLQRGTTLVCGGVRRGKNPAGVVHKQWCSWWSDGNQYRIQPPSWAWGEAMVLTADRRGDRTVSWRVHPTGKVTTPDLVPPRRRCPEGAHLQWPAHVAGTKRLAQIRRRLLAEFGTACQACHRRFAVIVDHDHFTGRVRGMLCQICNSTIDRCLHLTGCARAAYLNAPPAAPLGLLYPKSNHEQLRSTDRDRIRLLGYNPLYRGPTATRRATSTVGRLAAPPHSELPTVHRPTQGSLF